MNRTSIIALAISTIVGFSACAQNLLLNGSFESPAIATNTFSGVTPAFWTTGGTSPAFIHSSDSGDPFTWPLPSDGRQFADIGNNDVTSMSQHFSITDQGIYVLSWYDCAGNSGGFTTSPYSVGVISEANGT